MIIVTLFLFRRSRRLTRNGLTGGAEKGQDRFTQLVYRGQIPVGYLVVFPVLGVDEAKDLQTTQGVTDGSGQPIAVAMERR